MAMGKAVGVTLGLVILGIILTAVGAVIEPTSNVTRAGTSIVDNVGQVLIAFGLTVFLAGLGFALAWVGGKAMAAKMM